MWQGSAGLTMLIHALVVFLAAPLLLATPPVGMDSADEYEIKAAMYVNTLRLVDWPAAKRGDPASPLVIGVAGSDEMARALETIARSKNASGRRFTIRRISGTVGLEDCHSVFLGGGDRKKIQAALQSLGREPVLTIGEDDSFIPLGGMIALALRNGTVEIEVNLDVVRNDGLSISSQLLKIAILRSGNK
jgi:hypothetical protein